MDTDGGRGGVFVAVDDIDHGWADLRQRLLAEPMSRIEFPPHVTIAHPRTAADGTACYAALRGDRIDADMYVREALFTETTPVRFTVRQRFALAGVVPRASEHNS